MANCSSCRSTCTCLTVDAAPDLPAAWAELRRAAGQHSAAAGVPEAIHRDNLVLHDGSDD